jgi:hypothetical protein
MTKTVKRFFKRLKLKFYLWTKNSNSLVPTYEGEVSSYEKTCFKICLKVIKHPETKFMIAPKSNKRYIENKLMDIFITMFDGEIDITNNVCPYHVKLNKRDWERITFIFDNETEKRRINYEELRNSQIKNSLDYVLEKISTKN